MKATWICTVQILFLFFLCSRLSTSYYENCTYSENKSPQPELYWINLDRSKDRMEKMQRTLTVVKMPNRRVCGLDVRAGHIYLPPDIEKTWPGAWL